MTIIAPIVPPPGGWGPLGNVQPFTRRSGESYLSLLYRFREYIIQLTDAVNNAFDATKEEIQTQLAANIASVNEALNEQAAAINAALAEQTAEVNAAIQQVINASIVLNDSIVNSILINPATTTAIYINGLIAAVTPIPAARPVGRGEHMVSVTDFGADKTGAADSTVAIQAAIDSLATKGGTVWFPLGTYKQNGMLYMKKGGVSLAGANPLIVQAAGMYILVGDTANPVINNATISGLRFHRDAFATGDFCIGYIRSRSVEVTGCVFENADKAIVAIPSAIVGSHDNSSWNIHHNKFINVNYAWYVDLDGAAPWGATADSRFCDNVVNVAYICGVYIASIDGVTINGNTVFMINYGSTNVKKALKTNCIFSGRNGWLHIHDNNLFEAGTEGILLQGCSSAVNVTGNNVAWPGERIISDGIKIVTLGFTGYNTDIVVTNNVIDKYTGNGISVYNPVDALSIVPNSLNFDPVAVTYFGQPRVTQTGTFNVIPVDDATQYAVGTYVDIVQLPSTVIASNRQVTAVNTTNGAQTILVSGAPVAVAVSVSGSAGMVFTPTGVLPTLTTASHNRYFIDDTAGVAFAIDTGTYSSRVGEEDKLPATSVTINKHFYGRFYAECTTNAILPPSFGAGPANICSLTDALRSTSGYTGTLVIEVRNGLNSNDRAASYTIHVGKTSQGAECYLVGTPVGAVAGANALDPSFTFSVDGTGNFLVATPINLTRGSHYFYIHSTGNIIVK